MPTRAQLLKLAEEADRQAVELEAELVKIRELAVMLREAAKKATERRLPKGRDLSIVDNSMTEAHKLAISRGHGKGKRKDAAFAACIRRAGYTQNSLARRLAVDPALLSRYRRGERPVPQERADAVKDLSGWPADAKHWPGGLIPRD